MTSGDGFLVGYICGIVTAITLYFTYPNPNFRQSSSPSESGAESAHSGKQNTADKSELLPTQLPKEK